MNREFLKPKARPRRPVSSRPTAVTASFSRPTRRRRRWLGAEPTPFSLFFYPRNFSIDHDEAFAGDWETEGRILCRLTCKATRATPLCFWLFNLCVCVGAGEGVVYDVCVYLFPYRRSSPHEKVKNGWDSARGRGLLSYNIQCSKPLTFFSIMSWSLQLL